MEIKSHHKSISTHMFPLERFPCWTHLFSSNPKFFSTYKE
jgi:hypothetical protein